MVKRGPDGLLANMYEFDETPPAEYERMESLGQYTHIFSHVEWHMDAQMLYVKEGDNFYTIDQIENELAVPSAFMPFFEEAREKLEKEIE